MAWAARGHWHCRTEEFAQAVDDLTVAIRLGHDFADAFCERGIAYLATGEVDRALLGLSYQSLAAFEAQFHSHSSLIEAA
jgi:hypothetical protein